METDSELQVCDTTMTTERSGSLGRVPLTDASAITLLCAEGGTGRSHQTVRSCSCVNIHMDVLPSESHSGKDTPGHRLPSVEECEDEV